MANSGLVSTFAVIVRINWYATASDFSDVFALAGTKYF